LGLVGIFLISTDDVFARNSGRQCDAECQPPTLGLNLQSRRYVSDGFGINGQFFDVEYFSQKIPTQNFTVGELVDISLRVYENSGAKYLEHVALSIVMEEPKRIDGLVVGNNESIISWNQKFDGTQSVDLVDPYDLIDYFEVKSSIKNYTTILNFMFNVTEPIDSKDIRVKMWDYRRNSWNSYFYEAITVVLSSQIPESPQIPNWIRNNAKWWSEGAIGDSDFTRGIQYMIKENIISIPDLPEQTSETTEDVPDWVRNNVGWWADGLMSDDGFISGIRWLVENE
jgi:hypothetical protein